MRVILAQPRGFCAGVERAIEIVERALKVYGPPVYVRHEIVHNKRVVEDLKAKGAVFVEEVDEVPAGAITIFSAHGVSQRVEDDAHDRELPVIDATCPLVAKVHKEGERYAKNGYEVILIGHEGHPEVEGTMGRIPGTVYLVETREDVANLKVRVPDKLAYVTQTTLSVDDANRIITRLRARFPHIDAPPKDDICYATQNRQDAVKQLAERCDLILVVGSRNSSNSNRLREIAENKQIEGYLIDSESDIRPEWLRGKSRVGVTAGASAPELLVQNVVGYLQRHGAGEVTSLGFTEDVIFPLPKLLRTSAH